MPSLALAADVTSCGQVMLPAGFRPFLLVHALAPPQPLPPQQVPFYAATLARARLAKAQERLAGALRDPAARADAWPPARALLLLKLWATVFPASGARPRAGGGLGSGCS